MLKKGDRIGSTKTGQHGIVDEDYDPITGDGYVAVYWGTTDSRRVVSRIPLSEVYENPTAEFPHNVWRNPDSDRQQVHDVQAGRDGEVDGG